jgi:hypothetical protein
VLVSMCGCVHSDVMCTAMHAWAPAVRCAALVSVTLCIAPAHGDCSHRCIRPHDHTGGTQPHSLQHVGAASLCLLASLAAPDANSNALHGKLRAETHTHRWRQQQGGGMPARC